MIFTKLWRKLIIFPTFPKISFCIIIYFMKIDKMGFEIWKLNWKINCFSSYSRYKCAVENQNILFFYSNFVSWDYHRCRSRNAWLPLCSPPSARCGSCPCPPCAPRCRQSQFPLCFAPFSHSWRWRRVDPSARWGPLINKMIEINSFWLSTAHF